MESIPNLDNITLNIALLIAVITLWRSYLKAIERLDSIRDKDTSETSRAIAELASAIKSQSDSITAIHKTVIGMIHPSKDDSLG